MTARQSRSPRLIFAPWRLVGARGRGAGRKLNRSNQVEGVWYRRRVTSANVGKTIEKFIEGNAEMWPKVALVGIEEQCKQPWKKMTNELRLQLEERYPHIAVRLVDPKLPRAYFGTSVPGGYKNHDIRKDVSVAYMPKMMIAEDEERFARVFGTKLDDPVEATLLAIYTHRVPAPPESRPAPKRRNKERLSAGMVPYRGTRVKVCFAFSLMADSWPPHT